MARHFTKLLIVVKILSMVYYKDVKTPQSEAKLVTISRLLSHEGKAQLLAWARLACAAENSVRKLHGLDSAPESSATRKTQESSCSDIHFAKK